MEYNLMEELDYKIKTAEGQTRELMRAIRSRLGSLETALGGDHILNSLGELQALGPQLDASVAVLATLKELKREARKAT
jgi:hypothetical protein